MEYSSLNLFVILSFLVTLLEDVNACSCFPTHIQDQFCRSDYVIVATAKNVEELYNNKFKQTNRIPEGDVYPYPIRRMIKVRVHRTFKTNGNNTIPREIVINTAGTDAACGIELDLNKKYILGGYKVENDYWINLCGWVQEYNTLTRKQIKGIKFFYGKNCNCRIAYCTENFCNTGYGGRRDKKVCKWPAKMSDDCYVHHGVCAEQSDGSCSWRKNKKFKTCLQTNHEELPWNQETSVEIHPHVEDIHSPGYLLP